MATTLEQAKAQLSIGPMQLANAQLLLADQAQAMLAKTKIIYNQTAGRCAVSSHIILKGETILVEHPTVSYHHDAKLGTELPLIALYSADLAAVELAVGACLASNLYPREANAIAHGFRFLYAENPTGPPSNADIADLMERPEHLILLYMRFNQFVTGSFHALYLQASAFNHSCVPNCVAAIDSQHRIHIKALYDIIADTELLICYDRRLVGSKLREQRRALTRCLWNFSCGCSYCDTNSNVPRCNYCGMMEKLNVCGGCRRVLYCSETCQKADHLRHAPLCWAR